MTAPTINANAAIFFRILLMIGSFSCLSSSVKPKQSDISPTFYLLKQLKNSCSSNWQLWSYIHDMLQRVRSSRGRPLNAPAAFIHWVSQSMKPDELFRNVPANIHELRLALAGLPKDMKVKAHSDTGVSE